MGPDLAATCAAAAATEDKSLSTKEVLEARGPADAEERAAPRLEVLDTLVGFSTEVVVDIFCISCLCVAFSLSIFMGMGRVIVADSKCCVLQE